MVDMETGKIIKRIGLFLVICIIITACTDIQQYSAVPEIHFKSLTFYRVYNSDIASNLDSASIEFSFIDGDADLGVYDQINNDSSEPDSVRYGIFISFFVKQNGQFIEHFFVEHPTDSTTDTLTLNQLLPYDSKMDRVGQDKTVKGTIKVGIPMPAKLPYDTMRFEFYIRDRALHKSNVEVTDEFTNANL